MKEIVVKTWEEFPAALQEVYVELEPAPPGGIAPQPLFRGQRDATWPLTTTLERYPGAPDTFSKYWRVMNRIAFQIASYTETDWALSDEDYRNWCASPLSDSHFMNLPGYELIVHLRHHSFPSPLLDWSRSPWIAAYFAFREIQTASSEVAIFAYLDSVTGARVSAAGAPKINSMGPFVRTHRRHFLQQCEYTVCATPIDPSDWRFMPHDSVFAAGTSTTQDLLWKFVLPASERKKVLDYLEDYNIGAYSLFTSEEALMETLAARQFFLGKRI